MRTLNPRRLILPCAAGLVVGIAVACGDGGHPAPTGSPSPGARSIPAASASPTPGGVAIPTRPAAFEEYAETIARYLTANNGSSDCLAGLLAAWGLPTEGVLFSSLRGSLCLEADTDGDGRNEFIVAVQDPDSEFVANQRGDLLIFGPVSDEYELAFSAARDLQVLPEGTGLSNLTVLDARDIDFDRRAEVLFQSPSHGVTNLPTFVFVIGWDGSAYRPLTPENLSIQLPEMIAFDVYERVPSQGIPNSTSLVLRGDVLPSWGAGTQRARTYIYALNGATFELARKFSDPSPILYFNILDANEAFAEGDYWLALGRYRQAVDDESLLDLAPISHEPPPTAGQEELMPFAYFRLGLSYLRLGDRDAALEATAEAVDGYTETWHGKAARRFLDTYKASGDEAKACDAMTEFAESNMEMFRAVWDYGYGNPSFEPEALCLEPGLTPLYWSLHEWE